MIAVNTHPLDPIISEFATEEQVDSHDRWFRAKVQASLDDPRPSVPHDEAMARIRATIDMAKTVAYDHMEPPRVSVRENSTSAVS